MTFGKFYSILAILGSRLRNIFISLPLQVKCLESIMEEEYNEILNYDEDMTLSDDDRESRESLFNARRVFSKDGEEEPAGENNRRSRSPIRGPKSDVRGPASASSKERSVEPIETIVDIKTR